MYNLNIMANLKITLVLALLAFTTMSQAANNICLRNKFIGGPQNTIIKAQELLDSTLQYSNVSTTTLYFGTRTAVNPVNGETSVFYVFKINDAANTANPSRLLIMRITTAQQNTFVDDYILVPAPVTGVAAGITALNNLLAAIGFNFNFGNITTLTNADFFANDANAQPCNLIKEYYTYFYQVFGERFKKDLNK